MNDTALNYRRFKDGDHEYDDLQDKLLEADSTYKCPTYVQRTPPCQGSCPAGEDNRGWINIVRGIDQPPEGMNWQEYAFSRLVESNPFPAIMGRVCPAPCEDGCNRNEVEDHVGINSIEEYIGNYALENGLKLHPPGKETGKKVAIIGGGPAGLACAYHLRRKGHACTVFEAHSELGGMMRYGIPGYRTPREVLDGEIQRIIDVGVEIKTGVKIGTDIQMADLERDFDAIFVGIGAQAGSPLPFPGAKEASNCISGIDFLDAFNDGRLHHSASNVLVIGGGDTAMDVAAVAQRLGHITNVSEKDRPEYVVLGHTAHDVATIAKREGSEVTIVYRRPVDKMPATKMEIEHVQKEGVTIRASLAPVEVILGDDGRATHLRVIKADWSTGKMVVEEGSEFNIECDLIVAAIGQKGDLTGMDDLDNGWGLVDADGYFRTKREGVFVGGDAVKPHLITTAVGHASIAAESIDNYLIGEEQEKLPKINVQHFDLISKLREAGRAPTEFGHEETWGSDKASFGVHNYEDRSESLVIPADEMFLGHYTFEPRNRRVERPITGKNVLGHFGERIEPLTEEQIRAEADRCMACGTCSQCDNCVIYCPQDAVSRVKKTEQTMGRYVTTDYFKCIGCHICMDVCPSGYIQMGLDI